MPGNCKQTTKTAFHQISFEILKPKKAPPYYTLSQNKTGVRFMLLPWQTRVRQKGLNFSHIKFNRRLLWGFCDANKSVQDVSDLFSSK